MDTQDLTLYTDIAVLLARWPQTIPVFLKRHMACVGCHMSAFETVADAAQIYGFHPDGLLAELRAAVSQPAPNFSNPKELSPMNESTPQCLVCHVSNQEIPLLALSYRDTHFYICPQHFPILIHQPEQLVGVLPGAENLQAHEH